MTFPKFILENLGAKLYSKLLDMLLWQPCFQDLVLLKNLKKKSFCVNYFYLANVGSGSWQEHFPVFYFLLLIIVAIAIVLTEIIDCGFTANVSKYFWFVLKFH